MDYNEDVLQKVKKAIENYMLHRFPARTLADVIPNFDTIASSPQVSAVTTSLGDEKYHYIRKGIHELLDEQVLLIKKRGELHCFSGEGGLDSMLSKASGLEEDSITETGEDYIHIPAHLGFGTGVDVSLIWQDYDPDDR